MVKTEAVKAGYEIKEVLKNWQTIVKEYQTPNTQKAIIQILNSFIPFMAIWALMYWSLDYSYWLVVGLSVLNAFFLVRIFIIQHDCGHQSFLKSRKWNNAIGFICSFISLIPYKYWARSHDFHHAHNGQLETRDIGDLDFFTVEEYKALSKKKQFYYRIYRNPFVLFVIIPVYYLLIHNRIPFIKMKGWGAARRSLQWSNLWIFLFYGVLFYIFGWKEFLLVQAPISFFFAITAIWFFYVQHQHEESYKEWKENWEYLFSAIRGSTYYKLPKVMQWLTGNIGLHHIHHLSSQIPNYNLERCNTENPILEKYVTVLSFRSSLDCMFHKLWDEKTNRMITFGEYERLYA